MMIMLIPPGHGFPDICIVKNWWATVSLGWLVIVSLLGILLRSWTWLDLEIPYKNVLHAHSHLAFLGWVCNALFTLLVVWFIPERIRRLPFYTTAFILLQICNAAMLVSFIMQGYGLYSILFSTLHLILAGWFGVRILKNTAAIYRKALSFSFAKAAVIFMLLSSLGPLLVPVMAQLYGNGSAAYHNAIYFYLHFQYNGWFTFGLLALFLRYAEKNQLSLFKNRGRLVFVLLVTGTTGTLFQSFLWADPPPWVWIVAGVSGLVYTAGIVMAGINLNSQKLKLKTLYSRPEIFILTVVFTALGIKTILQFISAWPLVASMAAASRPLIIAYLHLFLLGFVTCSLLALFHQAGWIDLCRRVARTGFALFLCGFILSEITIVADGLHIIRKHLDTAGALTSLLMPAGIVLIFISRWQGSLSAASPARFNLNTAYKKSFITINHHKP